MYTYYGLMKAKYRCVLTRTRYECVLVRSNEEGVGVIRLMCGCVLMCT
jgi:hypothetical protein